MKILILKPSSLGDVVQALPVLRLLKLHFPDARIHWWLAADLLELLRGDPDLAGIYPFERKRWQFPWHWDEAVQSIRQMRQERFDYVIDLQGLARSGVVAWLARGQVTIGLDEAREGARTFYDIRVARPSPLTHAIDWYLEVVRQMKAPVHWNFTWLPRRDGAAEALLRKWPRAAEGRWIAVQPGARWVNKRWPAEHYAEVIRRITSEQEGIRVAILGGRDDRDLGEQLARANSARCLNLAGQTSLSEMVEWIRKSDLLISNDSGPMHVAAALGKPVVAIFGPTEPRRTGPYGQIDRVVRRSLPCAPCLKDTCHNVRWLECLRTISPDVVFEQVRPHLG